MWIALCTALALTAPFQDVQNRFSVDLPPGWTYTPMPGDTGGAFFRRLLEGIPANATVRAMTFSGPVALGAFAARIAAASDQEPGFHLLLSEPTVVAGTPGLKRRFVTAINGDRKWSKMVEQRIVVLGNKGFVLHAETLADAFGSFESDFAHLFSSFKPGTGERPAATAEVKRAVGKKPPMRKLIGHWEGGGHALQLSPGGAVTLDGLGGTYAVEAGVLVLTLGGEKRIYEVSLSNDTLFLAGGNFGDGQNFKRIRFHDSAPE